MSDYGRAVDGFPAPRGRAVARGVTRASGAHPGSKALSQGSQRRRDRPRRVVTGHQEDDDIGVCSRNGKNRTLTSCWEIVPPLATLLLDYNPPLERDAECYSNELCNIQRIASIMARAVRRRLCVALGCSDSK